MFKRPPRRTEANPHAVYNEFEPFAAQWLRNLSYAGHIARGAVDARPLQSLTATEASAAPQFHAFAGLGGWSHALRLAGWPDDGPVWTGSCPCQPFSDAGAGLGFDDERHLWPVWFALIEQCRPVTIFGEQVASRAGRAWLDLVHDDLEGAGYTVGAAVLPACGVGAPHLRERIFFVAERVADPCTQRRLEHGERDGGALAGEQAPRGHVAGGRGADVVVAHPASIGREGLGVQPAHRLPGQGRAETPWQTVEWLECRDGKRRPTKPGLFPLAHGVPGRVGQLRASGNAIVPQVAAAFIRAFMDTRSATG